MLQRSQHLRGTGDAFLTLQTLSCGARLCDGNFLDAAAILDGGVSCEIDPRSLAQLPQGRGRTNRLAGLVLLQC